MYLENKTKIKYNNYIIKIKNEKLNTIDILKILNFENKKYSKYLTIDELKIILDDAFNSLARDNKNYNKKISNFKLFIYRLENEILDIEKFIDIYCYKDEFNIWLDSLWDPLYKKKEILIENTMLYFMKNPNFGYLEFAPNEVKRVRQTFKKFLKSNSF